jgi:hypothetical protein
MSTRKHYYVEKRPDGSLPPQHGAQTEQGVSSIRRDRLFTQITNGTLHSHQTYEPLVEACPGLARSRSHRESSPHVPKPCQL